MGAPDTHTPALSPQDVKEIPMYCTPTDEFSAPQKKKKLL